MKRILGISAFYHDSAAALTIGGNVVAAAQEERFTRVKHTPDFPQNAIKYCLEEAGLEIDELDAIVFYDKPFLKFERLLETYYAFAPKGLISFLKAIPVWVREKLFLKKQIIDGLRSVGEFDKARLKLLFSEHHLSHAASAYYPSSFNHSAILTIDGVGEWSTASIGIGEGGSIRILKEMNFPHSVGLLYSAFTYFLGFTVNSGEYKLMGLAPYGDAESEETKGFDRLIRTHLVDIKGDGSIWLNQNFFNYATGLRMVKHKKWSSLFGFNRREPESEIEQCHCNLAYAIQNIVEEIVLKMAREAKRLSGMENLCMAGGVALNCVANGKLLKAGIFKNIFIQPAAGDAGAALGAALAVTNLYFEQELEINRDRSLQMTCFLGPDYSDKEIESVSRKMKAVYQRYEKFDELSEFVASELAVGKIVGWFQGRMEFGPRALGNRSILADPRDPGMQKKLNLNIKFREGFRPFAPSVVVEKALEFFDLEVSSPYMLFIANLKQKYHESVPDHYINLPLWEKLYCQRSKLQAITHIDFSARIQTVDKKSNPLFWQLLNSFYSNTGYPVLINTSFNVRGEPIVCSPTDAYRCFMNTEMDYLVMNNYVFKKTEQQNWNNRKSWSMQFKSD